MTFKRWIAALCAVLAVAGGIAIDRKVNAVGSGPCANLTPDDTFWWWWYECGKDSSGGGGSGAGD